MEKAPEDILAPIRSLWPSNNLSREKFAIFTNPKDRLLPQPRFNRPGPDPLRDYHHRSSQPHSSEEQHRRNSLVYSQATHDPWPSTFGVRGQPCISPSPSSDGQMPELQHTGQQTPGCITLASSLEYPNTANHFNENVSLGVAPESNLMPLSLPEIRALIFSTNRIRKPYKDYCKHPRGSDAPPDLTATSTPTDTSYLSSPTDDIHENDTTVELISSKHASIIKHKQNERNRRSKHDKWIRILDGNLPDRALEAIGVSLDNKKPVSKEQVLEMEVWYSNACRDAIEWLLRTNEKLELELAATKSVKAEPEVRREVGKGMEVGMGMQRESERCVCVCGRVYACLCVTRKPAPFSVEYRRAAGDNKRKTFQWGREGGRSSSPERYMIDYEKGG